MVDQILPFFSFSSLKTEIKHNIKLELKKKSHSNKDMSVYKTMLSAYRPKANINSALIPTGTASEV